MRFGRAKGANRPYFKISPKTRRDIARVSAASNEIAFGQRSGFERGKGVTVFSKGAARHKELAQMTKFTNQVTQIDSEVIRLYQAFQNGEMGSADVNRALKKLSAIDPAHDKLRRELFNSNVDMEQYQSQITDARQGEISTSKIRTRLENLDKYSASNRKYINDNKARADINKTRGIYYQTLFSQFLSSLAEDHSVGGVLSVVSQYALISMADPNARRELSGQTKEMADRFFDSISNITRGTVKFKHAREMVDRWHRKESGIYFTPDTAALEVIALAKNANAMLREPGVTSALRKQINASYQKALTSIYDAAAVDGVTEDMIGRELSAVVGRSAQFGRPHEDLSKLFDETSFGGLRLDNQYTGQKPLTGGKFRLLPADFDKHFTPCYVDDATGKPFAGKFSLRPSLTPEAFQNQLNSILDASIRGASTPEDAYIRRAIICGDRAEGTPGIMNMGSRAWAQLKSRVYNPDISTIDGIPVDQFYAAVRIRELCDMAVDDGMRPSDVRAAVDKLTDIAFEDKYAECTDTDKQLDSLEDVESASELVDQLQDIWDSMGDSYTDEDKTEHMQDLMHNFVFHRLASDDPKLDVIFDDFDTDTLADDTFRELTGCDFREAVADHGESIVSNFIGENSDISSVYEAVRAFDPRFASQPSSLDDDTRHICTNLVKNLEGTVGMKDIVQRAYGLGGIWVNNNRDAVKGEICDTRASARQRDFRTQVACHLLNSAKIYATNQVEHDHLSNMANMFMGVHNQFESSLAAPVNQAPAAPVAANGRKMPRRPQQSPDRNADTTATVNKLMDSLNGSQSGDVSAPDAKKKPLTPPPTPIPAPQEKKSSAPVTTTKQPAGPVTGTKGRQMPNRNKPHNGAAESDASKIAAVLKGIQPGDMTAPASAGQQKKPETPTSASAGSSVEQTQVMSASDMEAFNKLLAGGNVDIKPDAISYESDGGGSEQGTYFNDSFTDDDVGEMDSNPEFTPDEYPG